MKRIDFSGVWDTLLIVAVAALTATFAQGRQAQAADEVENEGRIVEISPNADDEARQLIDRDDQALIAEDEQPAAELEYWVGLQGRPLDSEVLRTHLQLAEGVGVVVENVAAGSPAEKAGLRKHDVLLDVNGEQISDFTVLQNAVANSAGKPIDLKIIRLAKEMTLTITPEKAPADLATRLPRLPGGAGEFNFDFGGEGLGQLNDMFRQLEQQGGMRVLGPGMFFNGQGVNLDALPGGVSVSITRENDGPAQITVRKDGKTWTVQSDDQEAIDELPDDVRPIVERMLQGPQQGQALLRQFGLGDIRRDLEAALPNRLGRFDLNVNPERAEALGRKADAATERLLKRMEDLEKHIEKLQRQIDEELPADRTN
jgi:membrane-associated protease RseP (regulator of RpoE activity)